MKKLPKNSFKKGFSLIELLVVITILIVLLALTLTVLNPFTQLKRFRDAQRKQDFFQIRNSLDTYYNDHGCYPASIPFGEEWSDGNVILMKKVPKDPGIQCITGKCYEYYYQTDGSTCSQWAMLYAKLEITPRSTETCGQEIIRKMCPGAPYSIKYNYCLSIGQVNCIGLKNAELPNPYTLSPTPTFGPTSTPTPSPTPGPTSAPTPTNTPQVCPLDLYYACTGASVCNNLGSDPSSFCQIHGGSYVCYCESNCQGACPGK